SANGGRATIVVSSESPNIAAPRCIPRRQAREGTRIWPVRETPGGRSTPRRNDQPCSRTPDFVKGAPLHVQRSTSARPEKRPRIVTASPSAARLTFVQERSKRQALDHDFPALDGSAAVGRRGHE